MSEERISESVLPVPELRRMVFRQTDKFTDGMADAVCVSRADVHSHVEAGLSGSSGRSRVRFPRLAGRPATSRRSPSVSILLVKGMHAEVNIRR